MIVIPFASLLNDREWCIEEFCKGARTLCKTKVCHNGEVLGPLLPDVVGEHVHRSELVNRHVEESLELTLVKVHREDSVCASNLKHVSHESRGDRHSRLIFLVRSPIAVVRNDGGDSSGGCTLEGVDHDQQLHDGGAHWPRCRLHNKDVLFTCVIKDLDEDVLVSKGEHFSLAEFTAEIACNLVRKLRVCVPRIDVDRICSHRRPPIPIAAS